MPLINIPVCVIIHSYCTNSGSTRAKKLCPIWKKQPAEFVQNDRRCTNMESAAKNRSGRSQRRITVMKGWAHTLGSLSMFTQLGLSLAAPLLLCVLLCSWLISHFALGTWVYIPGFFFGLGGSGATAWRVYQDIMKKQTKRKKTSGRAFNEHF